MAVSIGKAAIRDAQYTAKVGRQQCMRVDFGKYLILQIGLALVTAALIVLAAVVFFRPAQLAAIFAKVFFIKSSQKKYGNKQPPRTGPNIH